MLLGCLFIPSFELGVNLIDYPKLLIDDVGPIALVDTDSELILDVTSLAKSAGVNPRQTYSQAFGFCPELKIIQINWAKTNEITESFLSIAQEISPVVESLSSGCAMFDLQGSETYFGDINAVGKYLFDLEEQWVTGLTKHLPGQLQESSRSFLRMQIGISERKFTTQMAALFAEPDQLNYVTDKQGRQFLAPLSVQLLPLPNEYIDRLSLLGVTTISEYVSIPQAKIEAQFGTQGGYAWLVGRNQDNEKIRAITILKEPIRHHIELDSASSDLSVLKVMTQQLLAHMLNIAANKQISVVELRIQFETETGKLYFFDRVLKNPVRSIQNIWLAISPQIENLKCSEPISKLQIEFTDVVGESGHQLPLSVLHRQRKQQLQNTARHLKARYGSPTLMQIKEISKCHRLPERRFALGDYSF